MPMPHRGTAEAPEHAAPSNRGQAASIAHRVPWIVICLTIFLVTGLVVGLVAFLKTFDRVAASVAGIAEGFSNEKITETFFGNRLSVVSTNGAMLELVTAESVETFTRTSEVKLWDQFLPLGTTESEITVPATYRYHINLNDDWSLSARDKTCVVVAPMFKPTLPVAIDTGEMRKKTRSGWARFDKAENLETLEQSITDRLAERAANPENLDRVREAARKSVARFVRNWLLREDHWKPDRFDEIIVLFPDETSAGGEAPDALQPTIRLEDDGL